MKFLLLITLFTGSVWGQSLDVKGYTNLLNQKKDLLEKVHQGMSKKINSNTIVPTEIGPCEFSEVAEQTILRQEGDKIIIFSKETYTPKTTKACEGFQASESQVVFYENAPSIKDDIALIEESIKDIKSITKSGELITITIGEATFKYDLTKPAFKNLISIQDKNFSSTTFDMKDVEVMGIDLTNVFFCASSDSNECVEGDFSDILF